MRECREYREWIQAFMDGFLTQQEEQELKAHVRTCAGCTAYLRQMAAYRKAAMEMEDEELPAGLHEKIMEACRAEKRKTRRPAVIRFMRRNPFVVTAAAFALVVTVVFAAGSLRGGAAVGADAASSAPQMQLYAVNGAQTTAAAAAAGVVETEDEEKNAAKPETIVSTTAAAAAAATTHRSVTSRQDQAVLLADQLGQQAALGIPQVEVDGVYGWLLVVKTDGLPSKVLELGLGQIITADVDYNGDLVTVSQVAVDPEDLMPILDSAPGCEYTLYSDGQPWLDGQVSAGLVMLLLPNE